MRLVAILLRAVASPRTEVQCTTCAVSTTEVQGAMCVAFRFCHAFRIAADIEPGLRRKMSALH
eukprot:8125478-Pyramimonas_sp.AAC.1